MKEYETIYITHPDLTDSQQTQIDERLRSVIEKRKGRVFFHRSMGKKPLSYRIKKQTSGVYMLMDYAAEGSAVNELERYFRLDENILRFLTVIREEKVDVEARAAEVIARGEDESTKEAGPGEGQATKEAGPGEGQGKPKTPGESKASGESKTPGEAKEDKKKEE